MTDQKASEKRSFLERIRIFIEDHPWGVTGTLAGLLVVAVIALEAASNDSQVNDLKDQLASEQHKESSLSHQLDQANQRAQAAEQRANTADARATRKAKAQLQAHAQQVSAELSSRSATLDQRSKALDQREQQISATEQTLQSTSIPDGTWQYGRDFQAGTYRAPGGGSCYWATLRDTNTNHIIDNNVAAPNQTVTLGPDTPYFETQDCGKWVKIG